MSGSASDAGTIRREALVRNLSPDQLNGRSRERAQRPRVFFLTLTYMDVGKPYKLNPNSPLGKLVLSPTFATLVVKRGLRGHRDCFEPALKDSGVVDYSWHCNRHTFASRLVMAGVDLRTVGELLGHRTPSMTWRYSHLVPAHQQRAVDLLVAVAKPSKR